MEEIKNINLEITKLEKELEEKRKEIIKAKLREVEQNGVSEETRLTEEEFEILKNFFYRNKSYSSSALIQLETIQTQFGWEYGIDYDEVEETFFLRVGDKILWIEENCFTEENSIREARDGGEDDFKYYLHNTFGSKEEFTKPLEIEKLFIDEKLKQPENNIIDIQELGAKIGMEEKEQKLSNGKVINTLLWDQENLLKAVKEVVTFFRRRKACYNNRSSTNMD